MAKVQGIKPILGTASFGDSKSIWGKSDDAILKAFSILKKHGVNNLDSAQGYQGSEQKLGDLKAGTQHDFNIDTKWVGGWSLDEEQNTKEGIVAAAKGSLERLRVKNVDVFFIHAPIYKTSLGIF